ncbi:MAG: DUF3667 domain-containing protein [Cytophagia bacterium]|nr:DUF3667 domain-containing protein [Cytophagia bacterium]
MKFFKKQVDHFDYEIERTCLTCESKFQGKFCSRCGEKVIESYDRSFKHFFDNLLNAFTFIDGKFFNSFRSLLLQPGKMSADIAIGRRQPYMKPVAFFFVGNFIYFFFPISQTFNSTFYSQLHAMPYSELIAPSVQKYLQATSIDYHVFEEKYNAASTNWAKILLVLIVPITFPILLLVNYAKRLYASDHLIFALEFSSFMIFVPTIILSFLMELVPFVVHWFGFIPDEAAIDFTAMVVAVLLLGFHFFVGQRNFYKFKWWRVTLSTVVLTASLTVIIHIYRFLLFEITMWSLK